MLLRDGGATWRWWDEAICDRARAVTSIIHGTLACFRWLACVRKSGDQEPSQNNFSKSTLLLYDPWRESPVFCLRISGSCSSIQIPYGH